MASKYDSVSGNLQRIRAAGLHAEADRQEKIDKAKEDLRKAYPDEITTPQGQATVYKQVREALDAVSEKASQLELLKEALQQILADSFESAGLSSLKLADGSSISIQPEPYAAIKDPAALRAWAKANGLEGSMTLPWQTVNAISKANLLAGEALPDGVEVYLKTDKVVMRKS